MAEIPVDQEEHASGSGEDVDEELAEGFGSTFAATAFDQYFQWSAKAARTSSNVYSSRVPPISAEDYASAISSLSSRKSSFNTPPPSDYQRLFSRWLVQLEQQFSLLLYGAGSKREVLNQFAEYLHDHRKAYVHVINAFNPTFTFKDFLLSFDRITEVQDTLQLRKGNEGLIHRINSVFGSPTSQTSLYLVIHNLESTAFRSQKARSFLSQLVAHPHVHAVASVDNIAATLSWTFGTLFSNKSSSASDRSSSMTNTWLWHDVTTLAPYDFELSFADRSSLAGASSQGSARNARADQSNGAVSLITEVAARHVLASVTQKAKKLFVLLGEKQTDVMGDNESGQVADMQQLALEYSTLFTIARDNFVASNDTSLRALMSEFKDHRLMITLPQSSGELVWIPMRKKALLGIIDSLRREQI